MRRQLSFVLLATLLTGIVLAQTSTSEQSSATRSAENQVRFTPGSELRAVLDKTVDAKKAKEGDVVHAKTLDEIKSGTQVIAPRGSRVIGHVVAATPHGKDTPSRLEIAFDKLELENGSEVPLQATIQALSNPLNNMSAGYDNAGPPMGGGNSPMGGGNSPVGGGARTGGMQPSQPAGAPNAGNMGNAGGASSQNAPSGGISSNAQGVQGISGVSLSPGPAHDSMLTSEKHNVKLEGGTQMVLRVE